MVLDLAAGGAEGADPPGDLEGPGAAAELEGLADQGAGGTGVDAVAAEIAIQRVAADGVDDGAVTAVDDLDRLAPDDFAADLDAFLAQDAAVGVAFQQLPVIADRQALQFGAVLVLVHLQAVAGVLQIALAGGIADRAVQRMVDQHQFQRTLAGGLDLGGRRGDDDAVLDRRVAGGHETLDTLHRHHADTAGAGGGDLLQPAEGRDLDPQLCRRLQDGGADRHRHLLAVDCHCCRRFLLAGLYMCHAVYLHRLMYS